MNPVKVIKIGGKVAESEKDLNIFLDQFTAIEGLKVLVHGGGTIATKVGEKLGIEAQMVEGRRVTDRETLDIITMVYGGLVNKQLVAKLQSMDCNAVGLSGADLNLIKSNKRNPEPIDFGWVGDIEKVDHQVLIALLESGITPVIAPLTHDGNGNLLNTNADAIASFVARALSQHAQTELILCFDQPGVLNEGKVITEMNLLLYRHLRDTGVITDGMIPKLDLGFEALSGGVKKVRVTGFNTLNNHDHGTVLVS